MKLVITSRSLDKKRIRGLVTDEADTSDLWCGFDDFTHGPLPPLSPTEAFWKSRYDFWRAFEPEIFDDLFAQQHHETLTIRAAQSEQSEIWCAPTVQDVFFSIYVVNLLDTQDVDFSRISLRQFSDDVQNGVGALCDDELGPAYLDSHVTAVDHALHRAAWAVIASGNAENVERFLSETDLPTPYVRGLKAYLLRFPQFNNGLGSIDRALLASGTDDMKNAAYTVGGAMAAAFGSGDLIGDQILFRRLIELSQMQPDPWFIVDGDLRRMRDCKARLTKAGKQARVQYEIQSVLD